MNDYEIRIAYHYDNYIDSWPLDEDPPIITNDVNKVSFSVYKRNDDGLQNCIGDFTNRQRAYEIIRELTEDKENEWFLHRQRNRKNTGIDRWY